MMAELIEAYAYYPLCGSAEYAREGNGRVCRRCGHRDFNNVITAVAVFVIDAQKPVLLICRAREPARGEGGFVDAGETLEQAAAREVAEETGVAVLDLRYVGSFPNNYAYRGLSRPVCDVFFTARAERSEVVLQREEAGAFVWRSLGEIDPGELAFESMRCATDHLRGLPSVCHGQCARDGSQGEKNQ